MTKDFTKNTTYFITCATIKSKPDVNLTLYDTNSMKSLSTGSNSVSSDVCDSYDLCTNILQVNFQFQDNSFDSLNSLTCSANSISSNVPLLVSLQRNVSLTIIGIFILKYFYFY